MIDFLTEHLDSAHRKAEFGCGIETLDNYIHKQANQDVRKMLAACFVLSNSEKEVIGYYTLSNASIQKELIPDKLRKSIPRAYQSLPVTLLGRLAIDKTHNGKGLGRILLIDAFRRCFAVSKAIGSMAIIVDPIDSSIEEFYAKFGFIHLPDSNKMFVSMKTIRKLVE